MARYILVLCTCWLVANVGFSEDVVTADDKLITANEITEFFTKSRGEESQSNINDLELRLSIQFDLDSAELNAVAKQQLDELAEILESPRFENQKVELGGHSCDSGNAKQNYKLSEKRIESAVDYLQGKNPNILSRMTTHSYGNELPLFPGARIEEERALNRRLVVYLPENRETIISMLKEMPGLLGFRWAVLKYDEQDRYHLVEYDGSSVLYSNDEYRIFLRPARSKYVYLFQKDARGVGEWLFPRKDNPLKNPLQPGEYFLPNQSEVFALDNNKGRETIYCVVTEEPALALEQLLGEKSAALLAEAVEHTAKTRDLKRVRIGSPGSGSAQTIYISAPATTFSAPSHGALIEEMDIPAIMAQYRDFYMVVNFEHE